MTLQNIYIQVLLIPSSRGLPADFFFGVAAG